MKVNVIVNGRFHAVYLAQQLQKHGHLNRFITTYPKRYFHQYQIEPAAIRSLFPIEILKRSLQKIPEKLQAKINSENFNNFIFRKAIKLFHRDQSNLSVCWSGCGTPLLESLRTAQTKLILERGSTHIAYQANTLTEEYARQGLQFQKIPQAEILRQASEYNVADYISVPSNFVKQTFVENGVAANRIIVTPYGVETKVFKPGKKLDKVFRILFCGNVCIRKGIGYLLQAYTELKLPNSELMIVGHIDASAKSLINKFQHPSIKYLGSIKELLLPQYYSQASVFCLPSIEEGLALVLLQAMACGLPIITTPSSGGEDIITHGREGFVVPIRNINALKEKIERLYNDETLKQEMSVAAAEKAQQLSWDHYGTRMINNYREILEEA